MKLGPEAAITLNEGYGIGAVPLKVSLLDRVVGRCPVLGPRTSKMMRENRRELYAGTV